MVKGKYTRSMTILTIEKNNECYKCGFSTNSTFALKLHMKHIHKTSLGKIICTKCEEVFDTTKEFIIHNKKHMITLKRK